MAKLRVPTLQHLSRNWNPDPNWICRELVRLVQHPPSFSYDLLFRLARDLLLLGVPYEDILRAVQGIKRKDLRVRFLEILPLLRAHFEGVKPDYFQDIEPRFYGVGRGLMVPFAPPFIYGVGGQIFFPWLSFWRTNPIAAERLSLFVTIVEEVLLGDPDLETAAFQILDFSAPSTGKPRELKVIDAKDITRVTGTRKREMLEVFADGYLAALAVLETMPSTPRGAAKPTDAPEDDDMFGPR
jgi:hypothetical protein